MYNLQNKVALVTGAGGEKGIGRAIATRLAAEGADVIVNDLSAEPSADGSWGGLNQVVEEIGALGRRSLGVTADVSNGAQVRSMIETVLKEFGQIDILVNNAGTRAGRDRVPVVDLDEADWDRVMNINAKGTFLCSQAVARAMLNREQGGKIINISSTSGKTGVARFAAYCSSKFAVRGFTQSLALELGPHGINVNAICPNLVATERIDDMAAALAPEGVSPADHRRAMEELSTSSTPLRRLADVADIAATAAFLASSQSDYLTGLSISVAGGGQMY